MSNTLAAELLFQPTTIVLSYSTLNMDILRQPR